MIFNPKVIDFFKRHNMYEEEMFKYFSDKSMMIDYRVLECRPFVGTFPIINKKNYIIDVQVNVPYVDGNETMLITIHELVHAIEYYQKIGKKYKKDITIETLPLLYEKIYILEENDEKLTSYGKYLDSIILEKKEIDYLFGLKNRDALLKEYNYDMHKMQKLVKKLAKKS